MADTTRDILNKYFTSKKVTSIFNEDYSKFAVIHAISPKYDPDWKTTGNIKKSFEYLTVYLKTQEETGEIKRVSNTQVIQPPDSSPALFFSISPSHETETKYNILFYSHIDTIPVGEGWEHDPEHPAIRDTHCYARGSANGGYAFFSVINLVKALQAAEEAGTIKLPYIHVLLESNKENKSNGLDYFLQQIKGVIEPNLIICMEGENYSSDCYTCWNAMRGNAEFDLKVQTVTRAVHSGQFGGLAPDSLMIIDSLLKKIETVDMDNMKVTIPSLEVEITEEQKAEAEDLKEKIGEYYFYGIPTESGTEPLGLTFEDTYYAQTIRPALNIYKQYDIPDLENAAGVIRKSTSFRLNFKVPSSLNAEEKGKELMATLKENVPYNASVTTEKEEFCEGKTFPISEGIKTQFKAAVSSLFRGNDLSSFNQTGATLYFVDPLLKAFPNANLMVFGSAIANSSNIRTHDENIVTTFFSNYTKILGIFVSLYESF
ncbi:MAG: M20/M25/M40 family metallo-hydrolase [archaeon]|nr:M20/M25/M40 family metallo-hydrolase [archaeon]